MEKKRLFKILSKAESEKVAELGKKIRDKYPVTVIKKPEKTLAMIKMREPVQNSLFYLVELCLKFILSIKQLEKVVSLIVT